MTTNTDVRTRPRSPADETGEVTLALLREQFRRSFVPLVSEDGTEDQGTNPRVTPCIVPCVIPSIHEKRITGSRRIGGSAKIAAPKEMSESRKIAGSASLASSPGSPRDRG
jgi:hypothetical protein